MITARPYTDDDLPRLQAAIAAWIQETSDCGYCHVGEVFYRIYTNFQGVPIQDLVQIWEDATGIIGFAINLRFDNAFEVFCSPAYRGTDDEITMIQSAIDTTRKFMQLIGREEKSLIMDVWDCDTQRQQTMRQMGYEQYKVWGYYQERKLTDPIPQPVLPDGFMIRNVTVADMVQLAAVHNSAFGANWTPEEFRDELMLKNGYTGDHEYVVVASDGQFAAFTIMWLDEVNKAGLFEPVGVHRDFHRKGLGKALMLHVLHIMQQKGMKTALVGHDAENLAATGLYHAIGFSEKHTSLGFKKDDNQP